MMNERELLQLKKDIESGKEKISGLRGKSDYLTTQLKKQWSCDTIDEGKKKVKKLQKEIQVLTDQIIEETEKLESKYIEQS